MRGDASRGDDWVPVPKFSDRGLRRGGGVGGVVGPCGERHVCDGGAQGPISIDSGRLRGWEGRRGTPRAGMIGSL